MKKLFLLIVLLSGYCISAQESNVHSDSLNQPIFNIDKPDLIKDLAVRLDLRFGFLNHFEKGRDDNFSEFRMRQAAIGIYGKVHERVSFSFRNRYNREAQIQSLDMLGGNVELANIDLELHPNHHLILGKMVAFFGGYEYEYNPIEVLEYNDIQDNLLSYVTGVGYKYKMSDQHTFGFQALNSRTQRYADIYEGNVTENISEPKWPLALVANWNGNFWDGKFQTIYSYSRFRIAKGHGTTNSITLGNKFESGKFSIMYDFNYDHEQLDSKGIVTNILNEETIATDVKYIEHWIRSEYQFSPKIRGLITLMTSNAYGKNVYASSSGQDHLRTSYGYIPTLYYQPFQKLDLKLYVAYIGRHYHYSNYVKHELGITNYYNGEVRIGFIAPLLIL